MRFVARIWETFSLEQDEPNPNLPLAAAAPSSKQGVIKPPLNAASCPEELRLYPVWDLARPFQEGAEVITQCSIWKGGFWLRAENKRNRL